MKKWSFFNIPHAPSHPRFHPTHLCPNIPFFPPLLSGKGSSEILPWAKRCSGSYFSVKRMRKILFSHLPSEAPSCWTKMGDHQMELCFLQLIFFFWLPLSKTPLFRERSAPQTQHSPRCMHQLMLCQILLELKPSQLALLPRIQMRSSTGNDYTRFFLNSN